jgi:two-component system response regulator FixJ
MTAEPIIYIVDDDDAVRSSLSLLLKTEDFNTATFESGDEFLAACPDQGAGCILLDIRMPGTNGLMVQKALAEKNCTLPIIFITGHGDIPMAVDAMQDGAFDFIQKPFRDQELLDRIRQALDAQQAEQDQNEELQELRRRLDTLTPREMEVMDLVSQGGANKVIAMDLGLSQRTVEGHRARVMEKMGARSLAALVRMSLQLKE